MPIVTNRKPLMISLQKQNLQRVCKSVAGIYSGAKYLHLFCSMRRSVLEISENLRLG